ncbi:MAG: biotin/lipoyl-containing protein [Candidatus Methylomirabilales bacterium]
MGREEDAVVIAAVQAFGSAPGGAPALIWQTAPDGWSMAGRLEATGMSADRSEARAAAGRHAPRTYRVSLAGRTYEVTVEEVHVPGGGPPGAPANHAAPRPGLRPAPARLAQQHVVRAPMPGTVLAVKVAPGDRVVSGSALVVLEAMKMENDLLSSVDGTVQRVVAQAGQSVNTGDVLLVIA